MSDHSASEFSRLFDPAGLGAATKEISLKARPDERAALARRLGLVDLESLTADLLLEREGPEVIRLSGELESTLVQTCVVTNEPFGAQVRVSLSRRYLQGRAARQAEVEDIDPEGDDPPEPLGDADLDLGEVVSEELALALDPYPRKPGLAPLNYSLGDEPGQPEEKEKDNPFAVLADLKGKKPS